MALVRPMSTKTKLALVTAAYAAVLGYAWQAFHSRRLLEAGNPADVAASSGMYAAGDLMLEIFVAFLLILPTVFLIRVVANFEAPYMAYSKSLFVIGLSAPAALALLFVGSHYLPEQIKVLCFERLLWSPFILGLIATSRFMARFAKAKRVASYALLVEGITFCLSIGLALFSSIVGKS